MPTEEASKGHVAILGGGPSGLSACKAALEEGLTPTIFEKSAGVGGLWRQDESGKVWESLHTNLSKYTCAFSDFPWPLAAADFPPASQVADYLERFASANDLTKYLRTGCRVVSLTKPTSANGNSAWKVVWETSCEGDAPQEEWFEFVVVASGIFSRAHIDVPGADTFGGELVHSTLYKSPDAFAGKSVLIVGGAFTGADIAVDLAMASSSKSVTLSSRQAFWYIPKYINSKPADLVFYSRAAADKGRSTNAGTKNLNRHKFFASIVGEAPHGVRLPAITEDPPYVTLSEKLLAKVGEGCIDMKGGVSELKAGKVVTFDDGTSGEFDVVILATGYKLDLPFFDAEQQQAIEFDSSDLLQPAILHECVWRPELPNLAFVGLYRGPYFAALELQARWACGVFSGRLPAPTEAELAAGLATEKGIRTQVPRPQFPHGDYVSMVEALAQHVGVTPSKTLAAREDPDNTESELGKLLYEGPLLPFHFRLEGFKANPEVARAAILECTSKYPVG